MTRDPARVGRWREGGPSRRPARHRPHLGIEVDRSDGRLDTPGRRRRSRRLAGLPVLVRDRPAPYFVAFWVGPYDKPEIPPTAWLDADRRALKTTVFPNADSADRGRQEADLGGHAETAGGPRRRARRDEDVVVYLSAYAVVDHDKKIQILAADSSPYEVKTQLPLSWVLDRLKHCPAKNKLLVLDIMRGMIDPRDVGGTADGVGDLLGQGAPGRRRPNRLNDPDLMVIAACGPGQVALGSATLRHSVFGYYFHRALTTEEADSNGDGAVSVRELAGYLTRNVNAWAMHYRGVHQSPVLLGRQQGDFALAATRGRDRRRARPDPRTAKGADLGPRPRSRRARQGHRRRRRTPSADPAKSKPADGQEGGYPPGSPRRGPSS